MVINLYLIRWGRKENRPWCRNVSCSEWKSFSDLEHCKTYFGLDWFYEGHKAKTANGYPPPVPAFAPHKGMWRKHPQQACRKCCLLHLQFGPVVLVQSWRNPCWELILAHKSRSNRHESFHWLSSPSRLNCFIRFNFVWKSLLSEIV